MATPAPDLSVYRVMDTIDAIRTEHAEFTPTAPASLPDQVRSVYASQGLPLHESELQAALARCQTKPEVAISSKEEPATAEASKKPPRILEIFLVFSTIAALGIMLSVLTIGMRKAEAERNTAQAIQQWESAPTAKTFEALTHSQDWKDLHLDGRMSTYSNSVTLDITNAPVKLMAMVMNDLPENASIDVDGDKVTTIKELLDRVNQNGQPSMKIVVSKPNGKDT